MSTSAAVLCERGEVMWKGRLVGRATRCDGWTYLTLYRPVEWLPEGHRAFSNRAWMWLSKFCGVEVRYL